MNYLYFNLIFCKVYAQFSFGAAMFLNLNKPSIYLSVQQSMYVESVSQVGIIFQCVISRGRQNRNKKRKRNVPVQERAAMRTRQAVLLPILVMIKLGYCYKQQGVNISDVDNCMQVHTRILFLTVAVRGPTSLKQFEIS